MKITKIISVFSCVFILINSAYAARTVTGCSDPYETDVRAILYQAGDKWSSLESYVYSLTGINLSNCIENRFKSKGKVKCKNLSDGVAGKATPGSRWIKLDTDWLSDRTSVQKNRRACISALMAHEFAHNCFATESRADSIDEAVFYWWADTFGSTNSWSTCDISG